MKVVCDSTALIGLAKIRKIELLKQIYREVFIPDAVFREDSFKQVSAKPFGLKNGSEKKYPVQDYGYYQPDKDVS